MRRHVAILDWLQSRIPNPGSAILIVPALLLAAGCGRKPANTAGAGGPGGARIEEAAAIVVNVAPASRQDISKTVEVTGSLVALQDVVVGAKQAGRVAAVYLREGDSVRAGQVVAMMDVSDFSAQVQQAQANLQAAITREQQARAQLAQARVGLTQALNGLRNARTTLEWTDRTTVTAVDVAKAGLQSAQESLSIIRKGARDQERRQAEEQVRAAKSNYEKARADLRRYQELFREEAISRSQLDQFQAACDAAEASYNSAREALSLMQEGARPEDIRRAELAVQQARESLAKAEADRATVQLREQDVETARAGVDSARASVRAAEAGIAQARAGVAQARAALRLVQQALRDAYIKSPINGYVAERRAEPGQQVGGGGSVMRIVNPNTVYFQAVLSESQFAQVRLGQRVNVTVDALPKESFRGEISRILPVASTAARSFTVRVDLVDADTRLRPQMFARGSILIDTHRQAVVVPKDAVLFDPVNNTARVFVSNGKAEEREVEVGYSDPKFVEILQGIRPGEKVVTVGQNALQNGDKIRVE